jgi:hypothetical protein
MAPLQKATFRLAIIIVVSSWISACGNKEEAPPLATEQLPEQAEVVCSYAPSQSKLIAGTVGTAGGASAATAAIAQATGLTAVAHSSGAYILTGSGGYIAGTLGSAIAGPIIVGVGLVVGGAAVTVELLCAPTNHPHEVARVTQASAEFMRRYNGYLKNMKQKAGSASAKVQTVMGRAEIGIQRVAGDVFKYANR